MCIYLKHSIHRNTHTYTHTHTHTHTHNTHTHTHTHTHIDAGFSHLEHKFSQNLKVHCVVDQGLSTQI